MKDLKDLLEKKGMEVSPESKEAKMEMLKELMEEMGMMVDEDMHSMQEVTVAAPDAESMTEGLDKAQEIVDMMPSEDEEEDSDYDMPVM